MRESVGVDDDFAARGFRNVGAWILGRNMFAPIRGQLARVFVEHKADMGFPDATDARIVEHVDDIGAVLIALTEHATKIDDRVWLRRHIWWRLLAHQLRNELPTAPLDG